MKPTVQLPRALAAVVVEPKVTPVGEVAAPIVGAAAGLATVVSLLVLTCQRLSAGAPAAPEVTPRICTETLGVLLAMKQELVLSASVIVTV